MDVRERMRFDDSGQGMLPLMVLVSFSILVITFSLLVPWGSATTEKSQSQTAADAAALAAVQGNREAWDAGTQPGVLSMLSSLTLPGQARLAGCLSGADAVYASRNGATAVSCQHASRRGQDGVEVLVRNRTTSQPDTGRAEARAIAVMDVDLDACRWTEPPPPPPPTGPSTFPSTLVCGGWRATYLLDNVPTIYPTTTLVSPTEDLLYNGLEPRLVD
ncbi:pilus assembly protein TadG-related protein [Aquipuribacter sp. MA13-13]|uniref:pilus assembly protein TadG-related protein n=1 Tax=Aquipuribacter sp. MA13-13 TaxID=3440840 RepID=UPI003EED3673